MIIYLLSKDACIFKDKSQTAELWEKLNFGNKNQNVKFRKLMGIKASIIGIYSTNGSLILL